MVPYVRCGLGVKACRQPRLFSLYRFIFDFDFDFDFFSFFTIYL